MKILIGMHQESPQVLGAAKKMVRLAYYAVWFIWIPYALSSTVLPHQGRISTTDGYFDGEGQFKFALLDPAGGQTLWQNSPDSDANGEPDRAVLIPVRRGLYTVFLGDTSLTNMAPLDETALARPNLLLRIWFNDGNQGFERLEPDLRIPAPVYASAAATVPDATITAAKLAPEVLNPLQQQLATFATELHALSNRHEALAAAITTGLPPGVPVLSSVPDDPTLLQQGFRLAMSLPAPGWTAGSTANEPLPRHGHTAVWTGTEMWIWGGTLADPARTTASGAVYHPESDTWSSMRLANAPSPRTGHGAVWTGNEMIIWGGTGQGSYLETGGRLATGSPTWSPVSPMGAPSGRDGHVMVWTGRYVLVWGGRNFNGLLNDGALYDPTRDQWTPLPTQQAPEPRSGAAGVWTGDTLVVWGGQGLQGKLNSGARLRFNVEGNPVGWEPVSSTNAPSARTGHSAVWTGRFVIIWGGEGEGGLQMDGALYDPAADIWTPLPSQQAPAARQFHNAVWTGREMVILGGISGDGSSPSPHAFDPVRQTWRTLSTRGNPPGRSEATAVWTGTEVLHFGGRLGTVTLAALYRLDPRPALHLYVKN